MPTRLIREGILQSQRVSLLPHDNRWMYLGLLLLADEHGRLEYPSSKYLNGRIFPNENIKDNSIDTFALNCVVAGLIQVYKFNGKNYIQVFDYKQQVRSESKFPTPPKIADDKQRLADALQCLANAKPSISLSSSLSISSSFMGGGKADDKQESDKKTELKIRVGDIFGRKPETKWSDKENSKFNELYKRPEFEKELAELEGFYKSGYEYKRHDLVTFLNNWCGELDKSRNWKPQSKLSAGQVLTNQEGIPAWNNL